MQKAQANAKSELITTELAEKQAKDARFQNELKSIATDATWSQEKANALTLVGAAKNEAFISAMKGLLSRNNIEKVEFFYQIMKAI